MHILFTLTDSYGKLKTVKIGLLCRKYVAMKHECRMAMGIQ